MNLTEFARDRGIKNNTLSNYIARHPEVRKFTKQNGKEVELLPEAIEILDKVYPYPKPQIIQGIPEDEYYFQLREKDNILVELNEVRKKYEELQEKWANSQKELAQIEVKEFLLEQKEEEKKELKEEVEKLTQEKLDLSREKQELADQLEAERNKTLWQRIFG